MCVCKTALDYLNGAVSLVQQTKVAFFQTTPTYMPVVFPAVLPSQMFCHKLKMHNRLMGYAYLVDWNGAVRWRYVAVM